MKQGIPKAARDLLAKQLPPEEHLSADLLNGYVEQTLSADEKAIVASHLSGCEECREVVFLTSGIAQEQTREVIEVGSGRQQRAVRPMSRWLWWKWAAPALAAFVVAAAVLIERDRTQPKLEPVATQVAIENQRAQIEPEASNKRSDELAIPASRPAKKELAAPNPKPELNYENETYVKDKRDEGARRQEPGQVQTRYWALQQSQMARPQGAPSAAEAGGAPPAQPPQSTASAAPGVSHSQPLPAPAPSRSQTVEVTSGAPLVQADNADLSTNFAANTPNGGNDLTYKQKPAAALKSGLASSAKSAVAVDKLAAQKVVPPNAQWRITADGHLERAFSGGDWTRMLAEEPAAFRVVSVIGSDIWAGGNDGILFHSDDRGLSWDKVSLTADGKSERGAIVSIRFDSVLQGTITTDSGVAWTTINGGQSWIKH